MTLNGLEAVRKAAKKSQEQFASDLGMDQSQYSRLESGVQIMGESMAQRLARQIGGGTSASELALANKAAAFRRAMERGDRVGVLNAAKSFVQYAERVPDDPQLDRMLDALVAKAVKSAEQGTGSDWSETYDDGSDGRDLLGRRVDKRTAATEPDFDPYPLPPGLIGGIGPDYEALDDEEEDYDDFDEGRDIHGIRIRPLEESD